MPIPCSAGGTIPLSCFVKISGDNTVLLCGAGDPIFGISQKVNRKMMPGVPLDGNAALAGESLLVYQRGDIYAWYPRDVYTWTQLIRMGRNIWETGGPVVKAGAAFPAGGLLKSDANGNAIQASTDGDNYGALALAHASKKGDLIPVLVVTGMRGG